VHKVAQSCLKVAGKKGNRLQENRGARRGMGRVAFLANETKFRSLIEAGYPLLSIYQEHADVLGIGYPQFTRYVNRYLLDAVLHQRRHGAATSQHLRK
jgi:hypothetical protein